MIFINCFFKDGGGVFMNQDKESSRNWLDLTIRFQIEDTVKRSCFSSRTLKLPQDLDHNTRGRRL